MRRLSLPAALLLAPVLVGGSASAAPAPPAGFEVALVAEDLSFVTGLAFDSEGSLYASEANLFFGTGRVLKLVDADGDGLRESSLVHAEGFGIVTGIAFLKPNTRARDEQKPAPRTPLERIRRGEFRGQALELVVSHFTPGVGGAISIVRDRDGDGVAELRRDIVTGLPSDGQNGNQQPAIGMDGRIWFGQGARTNSGGPGEAPENASILRVAPDGTGLEVVATGLRNAYDLAFLPDGTLFATDNGPDPSGPGPVLGAPDELNVIVSGEDYGWPSVLGMAPEGADVVSPLALFGASTSTDGIAVSTSESFCGYEGDLFAAQFGSFTDPSIGRRVLRIDRLPGGAVKVEVFATGFGRPLDVAVGPEGDLYVADFSNLAFAPNSATIWRLRPADLDADGLPDICAAP